MREKGSQPAAPVLDDLARDVEGRLPPPRGTCAAALFRLLHARTPPAYFTRVAPNEAATDAVSLFELIEKPFVGFRVRVRAAGPKRIALESAGPDQPFILDSLLELLRVRGCQTAEVFHPIVAVERNPSGAVVSIGPPRSGVELVSVIHVELEEPISEAARENLAHEAEGVLKEARLVVQDFEPMLKKLREVEDDLLEHLHEAASAPERDDFKEAMAFLDWLRRANFVFLGYRGYDLKGKEPDAVIEVEHGSGLGILRDEARSTFARPKLLSSLPADLTERIVTPRIILVHKANSNSHVLRRTRMDYIGVKKRDAAGRVAGEHRFLGLFTSRAYNDLPSDIPILRRKLQKILEKANIVSGSHDQKEIFSIFTSIPKYELFMTETDRIAEMIFAIMAASGHREVRVSYRPDFLERGVSAMVLMPKEKFSPEVRLAIQKLLSEELKGSPVDYRLALGEEPMARLHFYFAARQGPLASPPMDVLEGKVAQLVRTWEDRLAEALEREHGAEGGSRLAERFAKAFPASYVAVKSPETAVADIRHIDPALREGRVQASIASTKQQHGRKVSVIKIYQPGEPFALSTLMPVLTNLGLNVLDEQSFRISPLPATAATRTAETSLRHKKRAVPPEGEIYLHSFRVLNPDGAPIPTGQISRNIEDLIPAVLAGEAENDPLNAVVAKAGLDRRQTEILRAYDAHFRQLGGPWRQRTTYAALCANPGLAALLVELFEGRFDPRASLDERTARQEKARTAFRAALEGVTGIVEDQVLRSFENLILASVRTNYFRRDAQGKPRPAIAFKLRCADVQAMPDPRPLYEIFVHCASVEGVHLRSGKVARGGIRWSSRPDDYRMEILGLMKAQRTKNAVIVPVGAKGGFILKRPSSASPPVEEIRKEYEVFIGSLLDVTDNIASGKVVHPADMVVHDEDDPYLVVAADRGTAAFSDTANAIAASRSFWLGDAFASGGSRGYNHKKEGITARGAWECVRRHFREMGIDPDRRTFTAAGIGDMSGDVFGNGFLSSKNVKVLAAFNHAHIFVDPDPDPAVSYEERLRLFRLPASAWTDYDPKKMSDGGGVFRRDAKAIRLSARARDAFGIKEETLNGNELVRAILKMPCDLLFNGGIGTYVKARSESHEDVSDPANDAVRVDGADLRARVVAEGGNLGFTQLGRIEYARAGGRINTDFIDNSAGVDLSDHEVNLKILLAGATARGGIQETERDGILRSAAPAVCAQVLRDNYLQGCVLTLEERRGVLALDEHRFLIEELCAAKLLSRAVERIPDDSEILRLRDSRMGLTRSQLAVLLAYAKIDAYVKVLASRLPDEQDLDVYLVEYFPREVSSRFLEDVHGHRLRREIAATAAVNDAINTLGISFFHGTARRTAASFQAIQRAFLAASGLCGLRAFQKAVDELYAAGFAEMDAFYRGLERFQAAMEAVIHGVIRRGLANRPAPAVIAEYAEKISGLEEVASQHLPGAKSSLPEPVIRQIEGAERAAEKMDIADLREGTPVDAATATAVWDEAGSSLLLRRVEEEAARIVRVTADEIQTCASLLEAAREHRRTLARAMLVRLVERGASAGSKDACSVARIVSPNHKERVRASRVLEAARTREPLTPSGLYVVVEALGRMVQDAVSVEASP